MDNRYIAILDSGVGGISTLINLINVLPNEKYIYFGDNDNAPYGTKTINELKNITFYNLQILLQFNPKLIVFACNTLSVSILSDMQKFCPVKIFGVYPPIENVKLKNDKVIVFATKNTISQIEKNKNILNNKVQLLALNGVVEMIESGFNDYSLDYKSNLQFNNILDESIKENKLNFDFIKKSSVILGCTHYFFVKNKIIDHLKPQSTTDGNFYSASLIKNFLQQSKQLNNIKGYKLLFIGKNKQKNRKFFNDFYNFKK